MNIFLNLIQKITHFGATEDDRSYILTNSLYFFVFIYLFLIDFLKKCLYGNSKDFENEKKKLKIARKLKNLPHTKHLIKTIRLSLEKVLEIEEINEKLNTLNMIKKRLFSEICIIKKFLSEINQLYEVQEDIERSFSKAETLWKQLKDLDNIVSQKLKEKNLYDYKKWKSKAQNDLEEYKKMRLNKLEKKKLDYDEQLRKFAQERKMLYENIKSIPSSSKEKASINLEEELKNIELPLILNELESFFGEIKEPDITNLTIFEKDDHKKHNPTIDIIEDEDFNSSE